ncbi:MAG: flagellar basal-body rod modification protein FlgD [Bacteroidia bacterium]|jgi:flagellar basal-body rod modification protein FlgD
MDPTQGLSELFPSTSNTADAAKKQGELGQEDFMELMVAQLENQDPTKPMDNFEFLSQIAQFGTVDGIQGLQTGFSDLANIMSANQTLQAAGLVGHKVITESNLGVLAPEETLDATIDVPQNTPNITLFVQDMSGRLVHSRELGAAAAGDLKVQWDGTDDQGNMAPPGQYRVSAEAIISGQTQAASVYAHSLVESVSVDPTGGGVALNLAGGDQVGLSAVKGIL